MKPSEEIESVTYKGSKNMNQTYSMDNSLPNSLTIEVDDGRMSYGIDTNKKAGFCPGGGCDVVPYAPFLLIPCE